MIWIVRILKALLTLGFLGAGAAKLANAEQASAQAAELGLPGWFMLFIGVCEVAGAIGLWVPRCVIPAALGLGVIMIGAVGSLLRASHPAGETVPALVFLALLVAVVLLTRKLGATAPAEA